MAEIDEIIEQPSESQKRITQLSGKVKEQADLAATEKQGREAAEAKALEVERERDFYAGFSDVVATNPAAKDHRDEILGKVKSGYSVEDATFAVLGKAGKLNQPRVEVQNNPAGGSATTNLPQQGTEKPIGEMTQAERRAELASRSDLVNILAPRNQ